MNIALYADIRFLVRVIVALLSLSPLTVHANWDSTETRRSLRVIVVLATTGNIVRLLLWLSCLLGEDRGRSTDVNDEAAKLRDARWEGLTAGAGGGGLFGSTMMPVAVPPRSCKNLINTTGTGDSCCPTKSNAV